MVAPIGDPGYEILAPTPLPSRRLKLTYQSKTFVRVRGEVLSRPGLVVVPATTPQDSCDDFKCGLVVYRIYDVLLEIFYACADSCAQGSPIRPKKV